MGTTPGVLLQYTKNDARRMRSLDGNDVVHANLVNGKRRQTRVHNRRVDFSSSSLSSANSSKVYSSSPTTRRRVTDQVTDNSNSNSKNQLDEV